MISIIIVGYNSKKDLPDCLESIYKSSYKDFRIIFVDNDSSDGSLEFINEKYPKVISIKNKNTGYAGGNNVGIQKAMELHSEYVFLLNPDTIIEKDCLKNLVEKADGKTILQPLILLNIKGKNTDLINTTGGHLNFLGFSYCSDYKENKTAAKEKDVAIASGAAAFIPTALFKKVGLFDKSFFMYHEDVDLFWRARLHRFNIRLIPQALVWHKYAFSKNKNKFYHVEKNRLLFLYKNFSLSYLILIFPIFLLNEILMLLYSLLSGWIIQKLKSYFSVINLLGKESIQRKKNLRFIHKSETKLKKYLSPNLQFSEINNPLFSIYNLFLRLYWFIISFLI